MKSLQNICVFCGASSGNQPDYSQSAIELADAMLKENLSLVYGGGKVGLMGVIAERMIAKGGNVIGVMPQFLVDKEIAHPGLNKLHIVESMSERKNQIIDISDAFILLPGGIGSLDEFFEVITLAQLGLHNKPRGILNTSNYYQHLIKFLDHAVDEQLWNTTNRNRLIIENDPVNLLDKLIGYCEPVANRWDEIKQPASQIS